MARIEDMEAEAVADALLREADSESDAEYPAFSEERIARRERDREKLLQVSLTAEVVAGIAPMGAQMVSALADRALESACAACRMWDCEVQCVTYCVRRGLNNSEIAEIIRSREDSASCDRKQVSKCLKRLLPRLYNHPTWWMYQVIAEECRLPPNVIKAICEDW